MLSTHDGLHSSLLGRVWSSRLRKLTLLSKSAQISQVYIDRHRRGVYTYMQRGRQLITFGESSAQGKVCKTPIIHYRGERKAKRIILLQVATCGRVLAEFLYSPFEIGLQFVRIPGG